MAEKQSKKRATGKSKAAVWSIIAGVFAALLLIAFVFAAPYLKGTQTSAIIRIPREATEANVRDSLTKYFGAQYSARAMRIFHLLAADPAARYGAYDIESGMLPATAARRLARGAQTEVKVTINGVRDFDSFIPRIAAKFDFSPAELRKVLANPEIMGKYGLTPEQAPSLFFNDTYNLYWTSSAADLVEKVGDNYNKFWNESRRAKAEALGLSPAEVMTLASIVDEESNRLSEKGDIGRLYINRLHRNMRLQADPTVRFALNDFTIRRVTSEHTRIAPLPYNTYRAAGLPPGPIRTTSEETVDAILNSSPSEYLYMCAREDFSGFHNFASTYEEHQRNARAYQKALDERGIK